MAKTTFEHIRVKRIVPHSDLEKRWFAIFKKLVDGDLKIEDVRTRSGNTYHIDLIFIQSEGKDIGFSMNSFYKTTFKGKPLFLVRPGAGIVKEERGQKFPVKKYTNTLVDFKLRHPRYEVLLFANFTNPILYAAACKYWKKSYPKVGVHYTKRIDELKQTALQFFGVEEIREHIVKGDFRPFLGEEDMRRFYERKGKNPHIDYFLKENPGFLEDECLVVMIPISWINILNLFYKTVF